MIVGGYWSGDFCTAEKKTVPGSVYVNVVVFQNLIEKDGTIP